MNHKFVEKPDLGEQYRNHVSHRLGSAALGAVLVLFFSVYFGVREKVEYNTAVDAAAANQDMWFVVAGDSSTSINVADRLGVALKNHIANGGTPEEFRGRGLAFQGIDEEVGYEVFNNDVCDECGTLSPQSIEYLTQVVETGEAPSISRPDAIPSQFWLIINGFAKGMLGVWTGLSVLFCMLQSKFIVKYLTATGMDPELIDEMLWSVDGQYRNDVLQSWIISPLGHLLMFPIIRRRRYAAKYVYDEFFVSKGFDEDIERVSEQISTLRSKGSLTSSDREDLRALEKLHRELWNLPASWPKGARNEAAARSEAKNLIEETHDRVNARLQAAEEIGL